MTSGRFRRIAAATMVSLTVLALAIAPGSPAQASGTSRSGDSDNPWLDRRFLHIASWPTLLERILNQRRIARPGSPGIDPCAPVNPQ
jgi:hypothetical protein